MRRFSTPLVFVFAFCVFAQTVLAVQLVWDGVTWPAGPSNSFDIDPANSGNDLTMEMTGNTAQFTFSLISPNPTTPAITRAFYQHIGIDNLTYSVPIPEPSPLACWLTGFGVLAARIWYRRTK
jgi:hypothetical protein